MSDEAVALAIDAIASKHGFNEADRKDLKLVAGSAAAVLIGLGGRRYTGRGSANGALTRRADGTFSVSDWSGYPSAVPRPPQGTTYRLLSGSEYADARRLADNANAQLRRQGVVPTGYEIHEIVPVKFGGSPTDPANKIYLPMGTHRKDVTPWWNRLQRDLER
ncbi:hypothetical protein ACVNHC_18895 [Pannonibacter sp. Q-1]